MTDPFVVHSSERGVVRVFTTDLDAESGAAITPENAQKLLGDGLELDAKWVEVFPSQSIAPIGLAGYLQDGYGVPKEQLDGTVAALDALTGLIVLVGSNAFRGQAVTLDPKPGLRFVGLFSEPRPDPPVRMPGADTAEGVVAPSQPVSPPVQTPRGPAWPLVLGALLVAAGLVLFVVL